jgi:transcription elongation factor Elf1
MIKFEDDKALLCPLCGGNNLHQCAVHVWQREEDSETGTYTCANNAASNVQFDADMGGNPSRRRSGLTIEFECESCNGAPPPFQNPADSSTKSYLHIVQHKGTTYLSWNKPPI